MFRLATCLALIAAPALAADWSVDPAASTIGFASIKNGDTAEAHSFGEISGTVAGDGAARIAITLGSVATGIDIRDERMSEMLFDIAAHPLAEIAAQIDMAALEGLTPGARETLETEITVSANGAEAAYEALLNVTRIGADAVTVSVAKPVLVHAEDLGYGGGVEALREVAELDAISPVVPVTFDLMLRR